MAYGGVGRGKSMGGQNGFGEAPGGFAQDGGYGGGGYGGPGYGAAPGGGGYSRGGAPRGFGAPVRGSRGGMGGLGRQMEAASVSGGRDFGGGFPGQQGHGLDDPYARPPPQPPAYAQQGGGGGYGGGGSYESGRGGRGGRGAYVPRGGAVGGGGGGYGGGQAQGDFATDGFGGGFATSNAVAKPPPAQDGWGNGGFASESSRGGYSQPSFSRSQPAQQPPPPPPSAIRPEYNGGGGGRGGFGGGGGYGGGRGGDGQAAGQQAFGGGFGGGGGGADKGFGSAGMPSQPSGRSATACRNCGSESHWAKECPTAGGGGGGGGGGVSCYNCNQEGHISRDCPQPRQARQSDGVGGYAGVGGARPLDPSLPPPVTYVPAAVDDETLLAQHENFGEVNWGRQRELQAQLTNVEKKIESWAEANLPETIYRNLQKMGYMRDDKGPTPIQAHAIPTILKGNDVTGCAQTGSGKTAAFLLPIMVKIAEWKEDTRRINTQPYAIVLSPTRELAKQTADSGKKFAAGTGIRVVEVYGQVATAYQRQQLAQGCDVIVATMGKLLDFVQKSIVRFDNLRFLVLDEADRMLELGSFDQEVEKLVNSPGFPPKDKRQTLMFSATFPKAVQQISDNFMRSGAAFIRIGQVGSANQDVKQTILQVDYADKFDKVQELLDEDMGSYQKDDKDKYLKKTLIFVEQKRMADTLGAQLTQDKWTALTMHGDREQRQREEALAALRTGDVAVLIATAVAARGLDIKGIDHVIIYDMPKNIDEYVHRIGRTGRVGHAGRSTAFYDPATDDPLKQDLVRILTEAQQEMPPFLADQGHDFQASDFARPEAPGGFATATGGSNDDDWS